MMMKSFLTTALTLMSLNTIAATQLSDYGNVLYTTPVGDTEFDAHVVEKNGFTQVIYSNKDHSLFFSGTFWDGKSGANLTRPIEEGFNHLIKEANQSHNSPNLNSTAQQQIHSDHTDETPPETKAKFATDGSYTQEPPELFTVIDSLAGFYENPQSNPTNNVYIIIDPRCPYCRDTWIMTRRFVEKGASIKWIPITALGNTEQGLPLVAALLQSENPVSTADKIIGKKELLTATPTQQTFESNELGRHFLNSAFNKFANGSQAGVPVAFYYDHRTQKFNMKVGVSTAESLKDIFGPL